MEHLSRKYGLTTGLISLSLVVGVIVGTVYLLWEEKVGVSPRMSTERVSQLNLEPVDLRGDFVNSDEFALPIDNKFEDELEGYLDRKESFIEIDLAKMEVLLFKEGKMVKKLPVLSKGREGSWWETPTGKYKIMTKEETHFSSIGRVWMPWSMQFYGNFFIHGWPHYADGSEVASSYSGGCVRLSTADAKQVYEFAEKGMAVLLKDQEDEEGFLEPLVTRKKLPVPKISAKSFLIFDAATGEPILGKNSESVAPIASLTKIMTGVVASELVYLGRPIAVSESMLGGALASFEPVAGENYVAFDLLYPLLMQSSNQAANILAGFIGRNQFISNMNKKAASLSMDDTTFADASGELAGNVSSPKDLAKLLRYTYFKRKFIFDISKGEQDYRFEGRKLDNLKNYNEFVEMTELVGIKNGETKAAGQTLAGVWEFENASGKVPVGIIVLGSENRAKDTEALLNWVRGTFEVN